MERLRGGLAVVFVTMALAAAVQGAEAADPLRITKPVQATKFDLTAGRTYLTPYFAIDPDNELHVFAAFIEVRTARCGLMRSTDGGQTWTRLESSPSPPSYPFCLMANSYTFQGKVDFGRDGDLYYPLSGWDTQDSPKRSVFLARSSDRGANWQTNAVSDSRPTQPPDQLDQRPISGFAVDRTTGSTDTVYVAWRRMYPGQTAPNSHSNRPMIAVSPDGGRTFSQPFDLAPTVFQDEAKRQEALGSVPPPRPTAAPPTTIPGSGPSETTTTTAAPPPTTVPPTTVPSNSRVANKADIANFGGSNPSVAVDDKGTAYVAWVSRYANLTPAPRSAHFLSKSSDRGRTWTSTQFTPFTAENINDFGSMILQWSPEGGEQGSLHMVYDGSKRPEVSNETDVFYVRSTDGGGTWTDPKVINDDDPSKLYSSIMPNITVAPNGRLDAVWFDTRDDPGVTANDVYHAYSTDNGSTWSTNKRATDRSIDRRFGPFAGNFDLNGPPALATADAYALIGWDDTRLGDPTTGTQDVFTAAIQYSEVGAESRVPSYVFAGVLGLLVSGLILLLGALVARRRHGGTPRGPAGADAGQAALTT
jgi:hypothetical protein